MCVWGYKIPSWALWVLKCTRIVSSWGFAPDLIRELHNNVLKDKTPSWIWMESKCDPRPSSANAWIRHMEKIDFRFKYTTVCTVSSIWIFKTYLRRGTEPFLRPPPLLNIGLRHRFGLRPRFLSVSRPRFRLRPKYSSGASCSRFGHRPRIPQPVHFLPIKRCLPLTSTTWLR